MGKNSNNELTKEMIEKAMQCKTAEELIVLANSKGIELTKEEAEAYLSEMDDMDLDGEVLQKVAGGGCYTHKDVPSEPCHMAQVA